MHWITDWLLVAVIGGLTCAAIAWQYRSRRTNPTRILLAVLVSSLPFLLALGGYNIPNPPVVSSRTPRPLSTSSIRVSNRAILGYALEKGPGYPQINNPLCITGLPPNTSVEGFASLSYRVRGRAKFEPLTLSRLSYSVKMGIGKRCRYMHPNLED